MTRYLFAPAVWRDGDSERRSLGVRVWFLGGEVQLGRRLYRLRLVVLR